MLTSGLPPGHSAPPLQGWPPASLSQGHAQMAHLSLAMCVSCGAPSHCISLGLSFPVFKPHSGMHEAVPVLTRLSLWDGI